MELNVLLVLLIGVLDLTLSFVTLIFAPYILDDCARADSADVNLYVAFFITAHLIGFLFFNQIITDRIVQSKGRKIAFLSNLGGMVAGLMLLSFEFSGIIHCLFASLILGGVANPWTNIWSWLSGSSLTSQRHSLFYLQSMQGASYIIASWIGGFFMSSKQVSNNNTRANVGHGMVALLILVAAVAFVFEKYFDFNSVMQQRRHKDSLLGWLDHSGLSHSTAATQLNGRDCFSDPSTPTSHRSTSDLSRVKRVSVANSSSLSSDAIHTANDVSATAVGKSSSSLGNSNGVDVTIDTPTAGAGGSSFQSAVVSDVGQKMLAQQQREESDDSEDEELGSEVMQMGDDSLFEVGRDNDTYGVLSDGGGGSTVSSPRLGDEPGSASQSAKGANASGIVPLAWLCVSSLFVQGSTEMQNAQNECSDELNEWTKMLIDCMINDRLFICLWSSIFLSQCAIAGFFVIWSPFSNISSHSGGMGWSVSDLSLFYFVFGVTWSLVSYYRYDYRIKKLGESGVSFDSDPCRSVSICLIFLAMLYGLVIPLFINAAGIHHAEYNASSWHGLGCVVSGWFAVICAVFPFESCDMLSEYLKCKCQHYSVSRSGGLSLVGSNQSEWLHNCFVASSMLIIGYSGCLAKLITPFFVQWLLIAGEDLTYEMHQSSLAHSSSSSNDASNGGRNGQWQQVGNLVFYTLCSFAVSACALVHLYQSWSQHDFGDALDRARMDRVVNEVRIARQSLNHDSTQNGLYPNHESLFEKQPSLLALSVCCAMSVPVTSCVCGFTNAPVSTALMSKVGKMESIRECLPSELLNSISALGSQHNVDDEEEYVYESLPNATSEIARDV